MKGECSGEGCPFFTGEGVWKSGCFSSYFLCKIKCFGAFWHFLSNCLSFLSARAFDAPYGYAVLKMHFVSRTQQPCKDVVLSCASRIKIL